jgi:hypothetical protein
LALRHDGILEQEGTASKHHRKLGDNTAFPGDNLSRYSLNQPAFGRSCVLTLW